MWRSENQTFSHLLYNMKQQGYQITPLTHSIISFQNNHRFFDNHCLCPSCEPKPLPPNDTLGFERVWGSGREPVRLGLVQEKYILSTSSDAAVSRSGNTAKMKTNSPTFPDASSPHTRSLSQSVSLLMIALTLERPTVQDAYTQPLQHQLTLTC